MGDRALPSAGATITARGSVWNQAANNLPAEIGWTDELSALTGLKWNFRQLLSEMSDFHPASRTARNAHGI
jgi:hypothetical protein